MSFFEIFQPGLRHLNEERARRTMLTSRPTHGGGAPFGIDLEAGVAKITVRRPAPATEVPDESEQPAEAEPRSEAEAPAPDDAGHPASP